MDRLGPLGKWQFLSAVGVTVVGYFLISLGGLVANGYQLNQRASLLQQEIQELRADNERLEGEAKWLLTDEAVEKLAREQLGWAKPGDTTIVVVPSRPEIRSNASPTERQAQREVPNWRRWWDLFFEN